MAGTHYIIEAGPVVPGTNQEVAATLAAQADLAAALARIDDLEAEINALKAEMTDLNNTHYDQTITLINSHYAKIVALNNAHYEQVDDIYADQDARNKAHYEQVDDIYADQDAEIEKLNAAHGAMTKKKIFMAIVITAVATVGCIYFCR